MSIRTKFILTGAIPMWACWAIIIYIGSYHFSKGLAFANVWSSIGTTLLGVWIHYIWAGLKEKK